ncbi:MAG: hypothetical protein UX08_C0025G0007 [Candidatus Collierbacteria bacterium GW2011_GWB1_45_35]|uniref:Uncharacterized protein n=2 Tax=Candidatus Collieribacteriota TaxID=1752725 RepID=A0A0G1MWN7_9BACT|nr:MAG: hypothetical protein UW48_C0017G0008 [Microgenomates group bacterium GW2011_GWC1_44_23]KKT85182.1 MAG: hypothetical protein UW84_C0040G0006 [Candidatus Collierbacteria bacterium GW2011_GWA2_44_99]KKT94577.1 MAG: hypothetical protein UW96_C0019G0022 [Candidatus Collierbacteria bacterium GW2011_GWA1_45_15]KKT99641.1 MAG: hypothetical protein UX01_C0008G0009 [Candidatus Collierbacteria bacterium GW2011_GWB2_45_17]KKU04466.1 MAG: hypothetical protein UX08_C0025G0007 [Candidatus Collierbacte
MSPKEKDGKLYVCVDDYTRNGKKYEGEKASEEATPKDKCSSPGKWRSYGGYDEEERRQTYAQDNSGDVSDFLQPFDIFG